MADLKISQLSDAGTLTGNEVAAGLQNGANVQINMQQIAAYVLANPIITGTSVQIGTNMFITVISPGDIWLSVNAHYDGANWQRVSVTDYAYALVFQWKSTIPGESPTNTGMMFLRATPASNPLSSFWSTGGWENGFIFDQWRHLVIGGYGIEVDGSGTTPYGRFIHYSNGNVAPKRTGVLSNLFVDLSGVDDNGQPSWFLGRKDDGCIIERAQAGSTSLSQLWAIGNTGMMTENAATYSGAGSPGTALLAAVNIVTSVAGGSNVKLATADNPGQKQVVVNATASTLTVNPPTSGQINGASTFSLVANGQATFYASDSNHWWTVTPTTLPSSYSPRLTSNITPVSYPGAVTSEQDLQTYSLPGGTLASDGQAVRIRAFGTVASHASATRTSKLYFGGTVIGTCAQGAGGPFNWTVDAMVVRTGATAQTTTAISYYGTNNSPGAVVTTEATPAETLSGAITIKTTGQSTIAQAADVVSNVILVELL